MRRSLGFLCPLFFVVYFSACGGDSDGLSEAGVFEPARVFQLSPEPVATIGVVGGDPVYELFDVRAAVRLTDGRTMVANRGTSDLRYYDKQGRHLRTVGGPGEGPGEFENLRGANPIRGDTIVTWDSGQRRVSFFDENGDVVHDVAVDISSRSVELFGASAPATPAQVVARHDGTLLVRPLAPLGLGRQSPPSDGAHRPKYLLYVLSREGVVTDSLGPFDGEESFVLNGRFVGMGRPVAHEFHLAAGNELVFTGSGMTYSFEVTGGGRQVDTVAVPRSRAVLRDEYWQRQIDFAVETYFGGQEAVREQYEALPRPDSLPAYAELVADAEDRLWVGEYEESIDGGPVQPRIWSAYDPDGRLVGTLTTPGDFDVTHIGYGFVTGVVIDELDVERVQVFRMLDFP